MTDSIGRRIERLFDDAAPRLTLAELSLARAETPRPRRAWPAIAGAAALALLVGLTVVTLRPDSPADPGVACTNPPADEIARVSPLTMTLEPNPVLAGTEAVLTVDGTVHLAAMWECWDGEQWVLTHYLMRGGQPIEHDEGKEPEIPFVEFLRGEPVAVVIPNVPSGTYRISDRTVENQTKVFVFVEVVGVVAPTTTSPATSTTGNVAGLDLEGVRWVTIGLDGLLTDAGVMLWPSGALFDKAVARDRMGGLAFIDNGTLWWYREGEPEPAAVADGVAPRLVEIGTSLSSPLAVLGYEEHTFLWLSDGTGAVAPDNPRVRVVDGNETWWADNGWSAWIEEPEFAPTDEGTPTEVVVEARIKIADPEGEVVFDEVVGTAEEPWVRMHDFDGELLILSRGPVEPAMPDETFLVLDLGCGDCTTTFVLAASSASLTDADSDWDGPIDLTRDSLSASGPLQEAESTPFDLGPLQARGGHSVIWTGEEMIVWGGSADETNRVRFADGAAFDPETGTWRMIAAAPLEPRLNHHAVWTGSEMVIVGGGRRNGAAYDPVSDSWRTIAEMPVALLSMDPITELSSAVWTGDRMVIWDVREDTVVSYSPDDDAWEVLPGVGIDAVLGALRWTGREVIALGIAYSGPGLAPLQSARLSDEGWVPTTAAGTSEVRPMLSAWSGTELLAWSEDGNAYAYQPEDDAWARRGPVPMASCEGLGQPLELEGRGVFVFAWCGDDAIYEAGEWTPVIIHGAGDARYSVWTGSEILLWGDTCCYGTGGRPFEVRAWRWTPPD